MFENFIVVNEIFGNNVVIGSGVVGEINVFGLRFVEIDFINSGVEGFIVNID